MSETIKKTVSESSLKKEEITSHKPIAKNNILLAGIISIFIVVFLWGFWERGIYAFGFNVSVLWILISLLFLQGSKNIGNFFKENIYWVLPLLGIILSFSLYENPFLKSINVILLPLLTVLFFSYTRVKLEGSHQWTWSLLYKVLSRKLSMEKGQKTIIDSIEYGGETESFIKKIGIGVGILFIVNILIISLLASADSNFGEIISKLFNVFNIQTIFKVAVALFILVFLTALKISWEEDYKIKNVINKENIDSIIAGIVIGGTLITYLVFIGSQIDTIITTTLGNTMSEVISLAKNGFWQLFFVSIINIIFFFIYFRKTNLLVQRLLSLFILASIIILLSAGHKMFMYVYNYGLSYEKLFASYTVLYFGVLFIIMLYFIFSKKHIDILKTSMITALIMYSFLNVFPTEKFIFNTNINISQREGSKINKYQSHILSIDILSSVQGIKGSDVYTSQNWDEWIQKRLTEAKEKKWYEKNINNF